MSCVLVSCINIPLQIDAFVKENAAKHKHLVGGIKFVTELPKNATGKVMRKELVSIAKKEMGL